MWINCISFIHRQRINEVMHREQYLNFKKSGTALHMYDLNETLIFRK